jgi:hypothetical protein
MLVIGFSLSWIGYTLGFWGHSLIKGYNLSFKQIASPSSYYKGSWPPPLAGNSVIIPDGTATAELDAARAPAVSASTTSKTSTGSTNLPPAGSSPAGISNAAAIQKAAALFGWGKGAQWTCLTNVINAESGGNPNALNASGAYGIAQALGHGSATSDCGHAAYGGYGLTAAQARDANCGNAYYQAYWMMGYIKAVYGNPCNAWSHEQNYHWY